MTTPIPEPPHGRFVGFISAVKGLTLTNVLIIALMTLIAVPVYFVYKTLTDPSLLDKFMSSYSEVENSSGCTIRTARMRGGPWRYSITTGFALSGSDRYTVAVVLNSEPKPEVIAGYCATLGLIVDKLQGVNNAP